MSDMRERFRLTVNVVDVIEPAHELPNLPVARAVWKPQPSFAVSAEAWLLAGAAHHTVMSTALGLEAFQDFSDMARTELVTIDESTEARRFAQELRWNQAYYRLAQGF
jgi:L-arabinose isomerase